jgi:hypothetical protein
MPRKFGGGSGLHPAPGTVALFENEAGVVFPEEAIRAHLDIAVDNGAHVRFDERDGGVDRCKLGTHRCADLARTV